MFVAFAPQQTSGSDEHSLRRKFIKCEIWQKSTVIFDASHSDAKSMVFLKHTSWAKANELFVAMARLQREILRPQSRELPNPFLELLWAWPKMSQRFVTSFRFLWPPVYVQVGIARASDKSSMWWSIYDEQAPPHWVVIALPNDAMEIQEFFLRDRSAQLTAYEVLRSVNTIAKCAQRYFCYQTIIVVLAALINVPDRARTMTVVTND